MQELATTNKDDTKNKLSARINRENQIIEVTFPYNGCESLYYEIMDIPSRKWNGETARWEVPLSCVEDILRLENKAKEENIEIHIDEGIRKRIKRLEVSRVIASAKRLEDLPQKAIDIINEKPEWLLEPKEHQKIGYAMILNTKYTMLLDEMGVGKTLQAVTAMDTLIRTKKINRCIVVCPVTLKRNIINEIELNTRYRESEFQIVQIKGTAQARNALELDILKGQLGLYAKWVIFNYEQILDGRSKYFKKLCIGAGIMADEFHKLSNPESKQSRAFKAATRKAKAIVGMTGTPITNQPDDLYNVVDMIQEHKLGIGVSRFRKLWCVTKNEGWGEKAIGFKNIEKLRDRIECFSIRRYKRDCLDLPPMMRIREEIEMTEEQTKTYVTLVKELQAVIESMDGFNIPTEDIELNSDSDDPFASVSFQSNFLTVKVNAAIALMTRLYQVSDGYLSNGPQQQFFTDGGGKFLRLDELVEEWVTGSNEQLIVFSRYVAPLLYMQQRYKTVCNVGIIHGKVQGSARDLVVSDFVEGKSRILGGQIKTIGLGLNLVNCRRVVNLDHWWNPSVMDQAYSRVDRFGQTRDVFVHDFVTVPNEILRGELGKNIKVIDQIVQAIIQRKTHMSTEIIDNISQDENVNFKEIREIAGLV